jgi:hypothetical protein
MWNKSVHVLRIRSMNLYILYTENTDNKVDLQTEFHDVYLPNLRSESVCILRIRGMNLFIY